MNQTDEITPTAASLLTTVRELEGRMATMTAALDDMRGTVQALTHQLEAQAHAAYMAEQERIEGLNHQPPPAEEKAEPSAQAQVREAVERARAEREPTPHFENWTNAEQGLWPSTPIEAEKEKESTQPEPVKNEVAQDKPHEVVEVALRPHFEGWSNSEHGLWPSAPPRKESPAEQPDGEDEREAVRRAVEEARAELAVGHVVEEAEDEVDAPQAEASGDEADEREAVRRAVEEARAELAGGALGNEMASDEPAMEPADSDDGEDPREAVRRMVEQTRAELTPDVETEVDSPGTWGQAAGAGSSWPRAGEAPITSADEELDPREAVRRAVEASRAELGLDDDDSDEDFEAHKQAYEEFAGQGSLGGEEGGKDKVSMSDRFAKLEALAGPSLIVIEDPEGRVELVQVYATLNQLEKAAQAALLNYTPHSVTVGLSSLAEPPSNEELAAAAESVFGRNCRVSSDGTRISVVVGGVKAA